MPSPRLRLALETMTAGDWLVFEQFAAEFLAVDYPSLRTTASPHGDRGRDGQIYLPAEEVHTALQYSVTANWRAKITQTLSRLKETLPELRELLYVTNQEIGPAADDLIAAARRERGIHVDIRDRSYFVERESSAPVRQIASEELARRFVEPLLIERGVRERVATALSGDEARIALLHLTLETTDVASDKGLTKSCFEALVLAALHDTSTDNLLARSEIIARVSATLPAGHAQQIEGQTDAALTRLSRRGGPVKKYGRDAQYHLSHEEQLKLRSQTVDFLIDETALEGELVAALEAASGDDLEGIDTTVIASDLRRGIETVLLRKGEAFARAATTGQMSPLEPSEVLAAVTAAGRSEASRLTDEQAAATIAAVLEGPSPGTHAHLRRLADAYTLFAFLQQTPDVQKVVVQMFSDGDLWLDTSVLLPVFAETLLDEPMRRHYTITLRAALEAGLRLFVTDGVIEELESHLYRSLRCSDLEVQKWRGRVPFIFSAYSASGRPRSDFKDWVGEFRGDARPQDDVRDYLADVIGVENKNLLEYSDNAPLELRAAVKEVWAEVHDRRRSEGNEADPGTVERLIAHDIENSVGVMQIRRRTNDSPLGYRHWWLTLDRTAFHMTKKLRSSLGADAPVSPALSPDFLSQLLRIGPLRTAVERELRVDLPLLSDFSRLDYTPRALIAAADELRGDTAGQSDRRVDREVRDRLDAMRATYGPGAFAAARAAEARVVKDLQEQADNARLLA